MTLNMRHHWPRCSCFFICQIGIQKFDLPVLLGLYKFYTPPVPNSPENSGKITPFRYKFSLEKGKKLLRPNFSRFPGPGETLILYRYFWRSNPRIFALISRKLGPGREKIVHRPRGGSDTWILQPKPLKNRTVRPIVRPAGIHSWQH